MHLPSMELQDISQLLSHHSTEEMIMVISIAPLETALRAEHRKITGDYTVDLIWNPVSIKSLVPKCRCRVISL